jgi:hypothetical protein
MAVVRYPICHLGNAEPMQRFMRRSRQLDSEAYVKWCDRIARSAASMFLCAALVAVALAMIMIFEK